MPDGVILAAGYSRRAGVFKPALAVREKSLLGCVIDGMAPHCRHIIVVAGFQAGTIRKLLVQFPLVEMVTNTKFRRGMFSSVKCGIQRVSTDSFFLLPGDMPLINEKVYQELLDVPGDIVVPVFRGRKGHPVLIKSWLIPEILRQPDDASLRDFIQRHGYATCETDQEGIMVDVDTSADFQGLLDKLIGKNAG